MHALTMLHRIISNHCPTMHAKRGLASLAAVEAVVQGYRLTLSELGRGSLLISTQIVAIL